MNNCSEYLELISAYVDHELTAVDQRRVEEHLSECKNCSALLDLYNETSVAVESSNVPAPEALCSGVMGKILSGEVTIEASSADAEIISLPDELLKMDMGPGSRREAAKAAEENRAKVIRIALTRYLPAVACLVIVLISLPLLINYQGRRSGSNEASPMSVSTFTDDAAPSSAPEAAAAPSAAGGMTGGGDAVGRSADFDSGSNEPDYPADAFSEFDASAGGAGSEAGSDSAGSGLLINPEEVYPANEAKDDEFSISIVQSDARSTLEEFRGAYALIEISGKLPDMLGAYDPVPLGDNYRFEMYFKIPTDVAQTLIDEIRAQEGIEILVFNRDSEYALVLYSPGV